MGHKRLEFDAESDYVNLPGDKPVSGTVSKRALKMAAEATQKWQDNDCHNLNLTVAAALQVLLDEKHRFCDDFTGKWAATEFTDELRPPETPAESPERYAGTIAALEKRVRELEKTCERFTRGLEK